MLCKTVADPTTEAVGTGPFMLESYLGRGPCGPQEEPDLLGQGRRAATSCRTSTSIDFIYSPDTAGQIEGLQGGALNWVGGLTSEQKQTVEANPSLKTTTTNTNYCYELQIRVDQGAGKDLAFRQALMGGHRPPGDRRPRGSGRGLAGNGTFVGPAYEAYYPDEQPAYDPGGGQADARRRRATPTAWRSSSSRRPPTPSRPSPPRGRRR